MRPKLLLDIDGILTDFHAAIARVATEAGFPITTDRMVEWEMSASLRQAGAPEQIVDLCMCAMASDGFNAVLDPDPAALENLPALQEIADVMFVTSPNPKCSSWMSERIDWMRQYFDIQPLQIVFSCEKHLISGDGFVDDNPENVLYWARSHPEKTAALWDAPYNRNARVQRRLRSWPELLDFARFLKLRSS